MGADLHTRGAEVSPGGDIRHDRGGSYGWSCLCMGGLGTMVFFARQPRAGGCGRVRPVPDRPSPGDPRRSSRARGATLLVALGILALLATFTAAFSTVTGVEKDASAIYLDGVRARWAARAGLRRAVVELSAEVQRDPFDRPNARWIFADRGRALDAATGISLLTGDRFGWAISGVAGATYVGEGDVYRLKILDCASMIDLNHPNRASVKRMVQNLCRRLGGGLAGDADRVARALAERRPPAGYSSRTGLRLALEAELRNEEIRLPEGRARKVEAYIQVLSDYATVHAWRDPKVLRPPFAPDLGGGATTAPRLELVERAPVNLNTAPKVVLASVLAGIAGGGVGVDDRIADQLADGIVERRKARPFQSWADFHGFVLGHVSIGGSRALWSLIAANADPNSDLNKYSPEGFWRTSANTKTPVDENPIWRPIDKADLVAYSTEFCFHSMGVFEISSLGRLYDPRGQVVSDARVSEVWRIFDVYRDTTQKDFETDRLAGGVGNALVLPDARGGVKEVFYGMLTIPEYANQRILDAARGFPPVNKPAVYDGQIVLNGLVQQSVKPEDFLLGFNRGSLRAFRLTKGKPEYLTVPENTATACRKTTPDRLVNEGDADLFRYSDLYPDGVVVNRTERGRFLQYPAGNFPADRATVEFWVKPLRMGSDKETYFYWGNRQEPPDNPPWWPEEIRRLRTEGVTENSLEIYRKGNQLKARASIHGAGVGRTGATVHFDAELTADVSDWREREWHHVLLAVGKHDTSSGNGRTSSVRMWVDGRRANPFPVTFPTESVTIVNFSARTIRTIIYPLGFEDNQRGRLFDGAVAIGAGLDPLRRPRHMAHAVIDNVFVQHFIRKEHVLSSGAPIPKSRYFDESLSAEPGGTQMARFGKRLRCVENRAGRLGSVAWTSYADRYLDRDFFVELYTDRRGVVASGDRIGLGERVYYRVVFQTKGGTKSQDEEALRGARWPIPASPVFDDVTFTYYGGPTVIHTTEGAP